MNDEIKEKKTKRIIEKIEGLATYVTIPRELAIYNVNIDSQEAKLLLDYINNLQHTEDLYNQLLKDYDELQKENNNLKTSLDESQEVVIDLQQRIKNAIDYIENNSLYDEILDYDYEENPFISYTTDEYVKDKLLNILRGENENIK